MAVMVCAPTAREFVLRLAVTPDKLTALPRLFPSTVNCTAPVGVPDPGEVTLTVAVNHTVSPNTIVDFEEATAVVVPALFTVWVKGEPVLSLLLKLPSPP